LIISNFYLKWYWILVFVTLGNVSPLGNGPILFNVSILETHSMNLVHSNGQRQTKRTSTVNPLQPSYLAAACIAKMILMVV
jgi:hypothetical protein